MNIDRILKAFEDHTVDYILIGGVNFLLNHSPELTFDVDLWIRDEETNRQRTNAALRELQAEWGPTEQDWKPVPADHAWLRRQTVFCLTSPHGAIDIFREVKGLEGRYAECKTSASRRATANGQVYTSLSDQDMLTCQMALPENIQKVQRVQTLRRALGQQR
jgi:hypothetical protein